MSDDSAITYKPLHLSRTFTVSREAVWAAWTDPEEFSQWWSPDGFTIPTCELDVRVGGDAHVVMHGPDGKDYPMTGTYTEVIKPERIVWTNTPLGSDGKVLFEIRQTILFKETAEGTTLEITAEVISAGPEAAPYLDGMEPGLTQALQKLARLLS